MTETYDNSDGSMDAAVAAIMGKIGADRPEPAAEPKSRETARADEVQTETDPIREPDEGEVEQEQAAEADAGDDEDQFLELPAEEEGKEPTRVKAAEALDAWKQMRQMNESVASAINAQEAKYQQEQDAILSELVQMHEVVRSRAEATLRAIPVPQPPPRTMLDERHPDYNPTEYNRWLADYEDQARAYNRYAQEAQTAKTRAEEVQMVQAKAHGEREYARLARHPGFQDFADPQKRDALEAAMVEKLSKHFGIGLSDLEGVRSHKLWLLADTAIKAMETKSQAPEVRKQVKETAVKITKGRQTSAERQPNGQFTSKASQARQSLRETGSSDAFAEFLISSGALRNR